MSNSCARLTRRVGDVCVGRQAHLLSQRPAEAELVQPRASPARRGSPPRRRTHRSSLGCASWRRSIRVIARDNARPVQATSVRAAGHCALRARISVQACGRRAQEINAKDSMKWPEVLSRTEASTWRLSDQTDQHRQGMGSPQTLRVRTGAVETFSARVRESLAADGVVVPAFVELVLANPQEAEKRETDLRGHFILNRERARSTTAGRKRKPGASCQVRIPSLGEACRRAEDRALLGRQHLGVNAQRFSQTFAYESSRCHRRAVRSETHGDI